MNPFQTQTDKPFVALTGKRCGYVQLAPAEETVHYNDLPDELFMAGKAWAGALENLGAKRVYWITLSEAVPHLHMHLYPRWLENEEKGLPLFEARNEPPQPEWTDEAVHALHRWAAEWKIHIIEC